MITFLWLHFEYDRGILDYTWFQINRSDCIQGSADRFKKEEGV